MWCKWSGMDARFVAGISFLLLVGVSGQQPLCPNVTTTAQGGQNFACENCLFQEDCVTPYIVKAMFMDSASVVENLPAKAAAAALGIEYNCDDPDLAVPECFMAENWNSGWVGQLASQIFTKLGANVVALTRANFSAASYQAYDGASSYTRCTHEVKLAEVDICVGDFWETNDRREIAPFSSSFDFDNMRLLTMPVDGPGSGDAAFDPIKLLDFLDPFTTATWGLIVAMFVFAGVLMYIVEAGSETEEFEYEDSLSPALRYPLGCIKSIYMHLFGFLTAGPAIAAPKKWPGRLISFGFTMFVYVVVASYAANLVAFLLAVNRTPGKIASMRDLVLSGKSLCLLDAMKDLVPEVPIPKRVGMDDYGPMLEKMYRNTGCVASLIGKTQYLSHVLGQKAEFPVCTDPADIKQHSSCADEAGLVETISLDCQCPDDPDKDPFSCSDDCPHYRKYCDIITLDDPDFYLSISMAFPVGQHLLDYISAWVVSLRLDNTAMKLRDEFVTSQYPMVCEELETPGMELTIEQMAGTFTIAACIMALGVLVHLIQMVLYRDKGPEGVEAVVGGDAPKANGEEAAAEEAAGKDVDASTYDAMPPPPPRDEADEKAKAFEKAVVDGVSAKLDAVMKRIEKIEMSMSQNHAKKSASVQGPTEPGQNGNATEGRASWLAMLGGQ